MFSHKNKKYSLRKVKNGVASVVIALLFASVTAPVAQARSVVGNGGDSAQVSSLGTTVLLSSGGFGTVHDGDPLLGGSGESESGKHDENSCPRPWGKVGDPAGEVCPRDGLRGSNEGRPALPGLSGDNGLRGSNEGRPALPGL
uniref:YSIRK-type signal peptide-containing protein n=1 Tax=Streptococcus ruminantium TaxID=1917441 RepID=UPI0012DCA3BA